MEGRCEIQDRGLRLPHHQQEEQHQQQGRGEEDQGSERGHQQQQLQQQGEEGSQGSGFSMTSSNTGGAVEKGIRVKQRASSK